MHIVDLLLKKTTGKKRSRYWPRIRDDFLKLNPRCEACGATVFLEVHHIVPFHIDSKLELDPRNLITLCASKKYGLHCHLFVGHRGNYTLINANVREDARDLYRYLRGERLGEAG